MSRANLPALPVRHLVTAPTDPAWLDNPLTGVTIREHFAGLAMQALAANPEIAGDYPPGASTACEAIAVTAVSMADALIAELTKPVTPPSDDYRERFARAVVSAATGLPNCNIPQTSVPVDAKSDELFQLVQTAFDVVKP